MSLYSDMQAILDGTLREIQGASVVLKGTGLTDRTVTALLGPVTGSEDEDLEGREAMRWRLVTVNASEAAAWSEVTIDGADWAIAGPPVRQDGSQVTYRAVRRSSIEKSRPSLRPKR